MNALCNAEADTLLQNKGRVVEDAIDAHGAAVRLSPATPLLEWCDRVKRQHARDPRGEELTTLLTDAIKSITPGSHHFPTREIAGLSLLTAVKDFPAAFRHPVVVRTLVTTLLLKQQRNNAEDEVVFTHMDVPVRASALACNILLAAFRQCRQWPIRFIQMYMDDSLGARVWVDDAACADFVANLRTCWHRLANDGLAAVLSGDACNAEDVIVDVEEEEEGDDDAMLDLSDGDGDDVVPMDSGTVSNNNGGNDEEELEDANKLLAEAEEIPMDCGSVQSAATTTTTSENDDDDDESILEELGEEIPMDSGSVTTATNAAETASVEAAKPSAPTTTPAAATTTTTTTTTTTATPHATVAWLNCGAPIPGGGAGFPTESGRLPLICNRYHGDHADAGRSTLVEAIQKRVGGDSKQNRRPVILTLTETSALPACRGFAAAQLEKWLASAALATLARALLAAIVDSIDVAAQPARTEDIAVVDKMLAIMLLPKISQRNVLLTALKALMGRHASFAERGMRLYLKKEVDASQPEGKGRLQGAANPLELFSLVFRATPSPDVILDAAEKRTRARKNITRGAAASALDGDELEALALPPPAVHSGGASSSSSSSKGGTRRGGDSSGGERRKSGLQPSAATSPRRSSRSPKMSSRSPLREGLFDSSGQSFALIEPSEEHASVTLANLMRDLAAETSFAADDETAGTTLCNAVYCAMNRLRSDGVEFDLGILCEQLLVRDMPSWPGVESVSNRRQEWGRLLAELVCVTLVVWVSTAVAAGRVALEVSGGATASKYGGTSASRNRGSTFSPTKDTAAGGKTRGGKGDGNGSSASSSTSAADGSTTGRRSPTSFSAPNGAFRRVSPAPPHALSLPRVEEEAYVIHWTLSEVASMQCDAVRWGISDIFGAGGIGESAQSGRLAHAFIRGVLFLGPPCSGNDDDVGAPAWRPNPAPFEPWWAQGPCTPGSMLPPAATPDDRSAVAFLGGCDCGSTPVLAETIRALTAAGTTRWDDLAPSLLDPLSALCLIEELVARAAWGNTSVALGPNKYGKNALLVTEPADLVALLELSRWHIDADAVREHLQRHAREGGVASAAADGGETIALPPDLPPMVHADRFWRCIVLLVTVGCFNASSVGMWLWNRVPTARHLLQLLIYGNCGGDGDIEDEDAFVDDGDDAWLAAQADERAARVVEREAQGRLERWAAAQVCSSSKSSGGSGAGTQQDTATTGSVGDGAKKSSKPSKKRRRPKSSSGAGRSKRHAAQSSIDLEWETSAAVAAVVSEVRPARVQRAAAQDGTARRRQALLDAEKDIESSNEEEWHDDASMQHQDPPPPSPPPPPPPPPPSAPPLTRLQLANLPPMWSTEDLMAHFATRFSGVSGALVFIDVASLKSRCVGCVDFDTEAAAVDAYGVLQTTGGALVAVEGGDVTTLTIHLTNAGAVESTSAPAPAAVPLSGQRRTGRNRALPERFGGGSLSDLLRANGVEVDDEDVYEYESDDDDDGDFRRRPAKRKRGKSKMKRSQSPKSSWKRGRKQTKKSDGVEQSAEAEAAPPQPVEPVGPPREGFDAIGADEDYCEWDGVRYMCIADLERRVRKPPLAVCRALKQLDKALRLGLRLRRSNRPSFIVEVLKCGQADSDPAAATPSLSSHASITGPDVGDVFGRLLAVDSSGAEAADSGVRAIDVRRNAGWLIRAVAAEPEVVLEQLPLPCVANLLLVQHEAVGGAETQGARLLVDRMRAKAASGADLEVFLSALSDVSAPKRDASRLALQRILCGVSAGADAGGESGDWLRSLWHDAKWADKELVTRTVEAALRVETQGGGLCDYVLALSEIADDREAAKAICGLLNHRPLATRAVCSHETAFRSLLRVSRVALASISPETEERRKRDFVHAAVQVLSCDTATTRDAIGTADFGAVADLLFAEALVQSLSPEAWLALAIAPSPGVVARAVVAMPLSIVRGRLLGCSGLGEAGFAAALARIDGNGGGDACPAGERLNSHVARTIAGYCSLYGIPCSRESRGVLGESVRLLASPGDDAVVASTVVARASMVVTSVR